jgi:archaellum component FlaD/FlaE/archaellum component FlaC
MIDNLLGDDEDEPVEDDADDEMDGLLDEPDDGSLEGSDDALMDDDEMSFDGMDDDDDGTTNSEMNNRIDELENEVSSLSSSVNTVKSENEQISESLDDVEENIRKLLEVYEMVTRGVNPFVNENELGDAFGGGAAPADGGSEDLGLFDDQSPDESGSDVDDDIADADADDFFDDDIAEDGGDPDGFDDFEEHDETEEDSLQDDSIDDFDDGGFEDDGSERDGFEGDSFEDDSSESALDDSTESSDEGKSFQELKAEYDSGSAKWDEDADADAAPDDADEAIEAADVGETEADSTANDAEPAATSTTDTADTATETTSSTGEKPYLESLPAGYTTDMVVMDWLEYLVNEAGLDGAARTIAYYESIEWLDEQAADRLETFLQGFGEGTPESPEPRSPLTVTHHNTSLRFISRIANPDPDFTAFENRGDPAPHRQSTGRERSPARPAVSQPAQSHPEKLRADGNGATADRRQRPHADGRPPRGSTSDRQRFDGGSGSRPGASEAQQPANDEECSQQDHVEES